MSGSMDAMLAGMAKKASETGDVAATTMEIDSGPNPMNQKRYRVWLMVAEIRKPLVIVPKGGLN